MQFRHRHCQNPSQSQCCLMVAQQAVLPRHSVVVAHFLGHCHHHGRYQQPVHIWDIFLHYCEGCNTETYTYILTYKVYTFVAVSTASYCTITLGPTTSTDIATCYFFYDICIIPNYLSCHLPPFMHVPRNPHYLMVLKNYLRTNSAHNMWYFKAPDEGTKSASWSLLPELWWKHTRLVKSCHSVTVFMGSILVYANHFTQLQKG